MKNIILFLFAVFLVSCSSTNSGSKAALFDAALTAERAQNYPRAIELNQKAAPYFL